MVHVIDTATATKTMDSSNRRTRSTAKWALSIFMVTILVAVNMIGTALLVSAFSTSTGAVVDVPTGILRESDATLSQPACHKVPALEVPKIKPVLVGENGLTLSTHNFAHHRVRRLQSGAPLLLELGRLPRSYVAEINSVTVATRRPTFHVDIELNMSDDHIVAVSNDTSLYNRALQEADPASSSVSVLLDGHLWTRRSSGVRDLYDIEVRDSRSNVSMIIACDHGEDECAMVVPDPEMVSSGLVAASTTESRRLLEAGASSCIVYHCFEGDQHCDDPSPPELCLEWSGDGSCATPECRFVANPHRHTRALAGRQLGVLGLLVLPATLFMSLAATLGLLIGCS